MRPCRFRFHLLHIIIIPVLLLVPSSSSLASHAYLAQPHQFELIYSARVLLPESGADELKVWVPLASSRDGQRILRQEISLSSNSSYRIEKEPVFGNELLYLHLKGSLPSVLDLKIQYEAVVADRLKGDRWDPPQGDLYLKPSRLMVVNPQIRKIAADVTEDRSSLWDKARAIYEFVIRYMTYDKTNPGWGRGDTVRACLIGKGNCTDFHSLFISTAMAARIASRFKIGFMLPEEPQGEIQGYHCWAEFFDPQKGWVSVDASEAWKQPDKKDFYFGGFDTRKFLLSMGRDVDLVPRQKGDPINILFYPYMELDGKEYYEFQTSFWYRNRTPSQGDTL